MEQIQQAMDPQPAFVLMHFLGGSTRQWDQVAPLLAPHEILRIDLPGFGAAAAQTGYSIAQMADAVQSTIASAALPRYILVGHSMSGAVAMLIASRRRGDAALAGLILIAPSPPGPEPMPEEKRGAMIALLGSHHADDLDRARSYLSKNEQRDIPPQVLDRAAQEVLRMNRTAWVAWLTHGTREDHSAAIAILDLPALVVAGDQDASLGPTAQTELTMPHLGNARLLTIANCGHLIPMESPDQLAALMLDFARNLPELSVPPGYQTFIASDRVSPRTREVLEARMASLPPPPDTLTARQQRTLRAAVARIIPQSTIDLAAAIITRLASGPGDGWRYAVLPPDLIAYREHLDALATQDFENLTPEKQDAALKHLASKPGSPEARWFEDLRSDATEAYTAHPATLARLGYSGIGVGGAHTPHRGFVTLGPNQREPWEPVPEVVA